MKYTYIDLINGFNDWCYSNSLDIKAQIIFFKILYLMNKDKWKEWTEISNFRLMDLAKFSSETHFVKQRDKLIELGFFEYQKGKKGQPNKYKISEEGFEKIQQKYTIKYTVKKGSTNDSVLSSTKDSIFGSINSSHIKTIDKEEDIPPKSTNVLSSPKGEKRACKSNKSKKDLENDPMFLEFWQAYPKKIAKQSALKAFNKISDLEVTLEKILEGVERWKASDQWQDLKFIPYPASFLNDRRWEDEVEHCPQSGVFREEKPSYDIDEYRKYCRELLVRGRYTEDAGEGDNPV
jgi:hypothetical protein